MRQILQIQEAAKQEASDSDSPSVQGIFFLAEQGEPCNCRRVPETASAEAAPPKTDDFPNFGGDISLHNT